MILRIDFNSFFSVRDWTRRGKPRTRASTQVGFAEFNNTADNRATIGGTIIGAPIVGQ